ncbi:MAG: MaoC family dehydratase [Burkholderiaceae bacterium]
MTIPFKERYFEDYIPGEEVEFGDYLITEQEILEFAQKYDPQAFHLDHDAAAKTHFGGLVASGWMTCSVMMRLYVDHYISPLSSMGSPGLDEIRWLAPVRPGDRLRVRVRTVSSRRSESKPDRGFLKFEQAVLNQADEVVLTVKGTGMYKVRPSESAAAS